MSKKTFTEKVREVVRTIPKGETLSYKDVALRAGNQNAARAVAMIMSKNYDPAIPCHRVICANGTLGGYNRGGSEAKKRILTQEGARVCNEI